MTIVWFDALTPKQAKIAAILYWELSRRSIGLLITTRRYRYVEETLKAYRVPYIVVGHYGETLRDKVKSYAQRIIELLDVLPEFDIAIGFPSPEMHRVAFGLGKPIITLTDTAHAAHVNRLCLPLSSRVIVPEAIPDSELEKYLPQCELSKVRKFAGVFEIMWVKRCRPDPSVPRRFSLRINEYVVYRPEEEKASYYKYGSRPELQIKILRTILDHNLQVVFLPRYDYQERLVRESLANEVESGLIIIPKETPLDLIHLEAFARLVITGGSTMALETCLMGVPALCYFPDKFYIDEYLQRLGFPLIRVFSIEEVVNMLPDLLSQAKITDVQDLLKELEDPTTVILEDILKVV